MTNDYWNFMKQLLLVLMVIAPLSVSAFEQVMTRAAIEKQIKEYRVILKEDPKNEVARDGLADMAMATFLLIEQAEEIGDQRDVSQLKKFIVNRLPDTAWRVENRAQKKQVSALVSAGLMYRQGLLVSRNRERSCGFYKSLENQENKYANYRSALCFIGVDANKMVSHMTKAAFQGHAIAQEYLARICLSNDDWQCMMRWLEPSAEKGRVSAMSLLAWAYIQGNGIDKDAVKGLKYYTQAAKGGDSIAQNNLAQLYEEGHDVKKDLSKAVFYYRLAAYGGFAHAQYNLGRLYLYGIGVKKDKHEAVKWLQKSKLQISKEAILQLEREDR